MASLRDDAADEPKAGANVEGVKSADRAMAILEVFRDVRRAATARELADMLGMPRSSTNVLLRSLIAGGYLRYDEIRASYFPTLRVFQLGSWLMDGFFNHPRIDAVMRELSAATRETICLWVRVGTVATVVSVIESPQAIALAMKPGESAPIFGSAVGLAFLAAMPVKEVGLLHERWLKTLSKEQRDSSKDLVAKVEQVRKRRSSVGYDFWLEDAGAVARAFIHPALEETAVLAVGGPVFRIQRNERIIIETLEKSLKAL